MRIIKNGASKLQDIQQFKCQICGCVYELNLCDEEIGECPCCHSHKGYQVRFNDDTEEDIKTKMPDEVYPEKFYSFKDGLDKSDKEIRELIILSGGCITRLLKLISWFTMAFHAA